MENVILVVHLLLALSLIGVVLLQRSEGGGLTASGPAGAGRAPATALGKVTWGLAVAFICTSIALTIVAAEQSAGASVVDRLQDVPAAEAPALPDLGATGDGLLPPSAGSDAPLLPQAD